MIKKIRDYAYLSDEFSIALVNLEGGVEWVCFPRFDSEAFFTSLLGDRENGVWEIKPQNLQEVSRSYIEGTNILVTKFTCNGGIAKLTDFMPTIEERNSIFRVFEVVEGRVEVTEELILKSDYGKTPPSEQKVGKEALSFHWGDKALFYCSNIKKQSLGKGHITGTQELIKGEKLSFKLAFTKGGKIPVIFKMPVDEALNKTRRYWESWSTQINYTGAYKDMLTRSALVLKGLSYKPTGALIAAASSSLPEEMGGERNWDYRYSWLRDSAFIIAAYTKIGQKQEAKRFFNWALKAAQSFHPPLLVGYDVKGDKVPKESSLQHLFGFNNSIPVRVGNSGFSQFQLDVFGEFLLCLNHCYEHDLIEADIDLKQMESIINWLLKVYKRPDRGLWEVRGEPKLYTHSQAMAWIGLDKGMKVYKALGGKDIPEEKVEKAKAEIREKVFLEGVDKKRRCFVQAFGSTELDASNLRLSLSGFVDPNDEIMVNTVNETIKALTENGFAYRYLNKDGLPGTEGAFLICSSWLIQNLALQGRMDEAKQFLERFVSEANDVGLFSEEIDPKTGEFLGNFPQAFTHVGLINAMLAVNGR